MDKQEYELKLKELEVDFSAKKSELMKEYIRSNNPYKIGDTVTDHVGSILIETMGFSSGYTGLCATYFGVELNKDGKPNKRGNKRRVYQSNLVK